MQLDIHHLEAGMQQSILPVLPEEYEGLIPLDSLGRGGTDEETGRQNAHNHQLCPCTSWWWMYPHPSSSYVGDSVSGPRELVGIMWFFEWLVRVTLTCAWLWVIISAMVIGMVDSCYARGRGIIGWTVFAFMLMLLVPTCGRGPCKLIHGEWPSALMVAAVIVIVFSAQTSRQKSHYECF
jgi:predicted outer membrane lipoprotein